ncbi:outer membrane lipoprotein-sorting protein [Rapidithrix thailandica]|uniref:Outer membrane lipoprotein-sorting protein n=1 Tax=Rapidithrix thailandica TaxID=413964 RepID=A0AAW9SAH3_9BACT
MKLLNLILPVILLLLLTGFQPHFFDLSATEIIQKADKRLRGKSNKAEFTMEIVRPDWKRTMSMKSWSKGDDYSLVLVLSPAKDKGTVSLKIKNEMWNWLPSIERSIKISPSMMMQSWMGSDFTNDDLIKQSSIVHDYTHSLLAEENFMGIDCYKIQMIPKPDAPVVWGKIVTWISKEHFNQRKTEYFDEDGELVNRMITSELKQLGGKLLPARMEMIPMEKEGHKTVMTYLSIDFDVNIEDRFFSKQNMRRVR